MADEYVPLPDPELIQLKLGDQMLLLRETPDMIYERVANRVKGVIPTEQGSDFYVFNYPMCEEIAEQQIIFEYAWIQGFPIWADGEFLDWHGQKEFLRLPRIPGESDDSYRDRLIQAASEREGWGRKVDYARLARNAGAGYAKAVEYQRNDLSVDIYVTDLDGNPADESLCQRIREAIETDRMALHDVMVHPAIVNAVNIESKLFFSPDITDEQIRQAEQLIMNRIMQYTEKNTFLRYHAIGALFLIPGVTIDYTAYTVNGGADNIQTPEGAVNVVKWRRLT
ncbi:baseplate J-like protein [Aneurinibacillus soli]|uniref:Baseplate J-like protein n=1 Tax=Aneurinibacillus soli TaxID=1500254 RepID=A0A0U5BBE6_9BACL|nr:baseplate J/gp47 family protein [Aneurinibacillus soli]PYE62991.1 baseplate J-like protein [Aneurinibacillus soli]BAU28950.1 Baseplate J-like protein [Aneurinibacillus soli]